MMSFGGFVRYVVTLHPMMSGEKSLRQSRVCVDGSGVGYYTDAGAFLPCEQLPREVLDAIREHLTKVSGKQPNMVTLPDRDEVERLAGITQEADDDDS